MRVVEFIIDITADRHIEFVANVHPGDPGNRSGHPDTWYPSERGEVEIVTAHEVDDERPGRRRRLRGADLADLLASRLEEVEWLAEFEAEQDEARSGAY